jgi:hypothetical protein
VFSTDSRHTNGYKLCFSSRRLVLLFVRGRLHTGASQEKEEKKLAIDITRYIDDVLSLTNYNFGDFVDRIYPIWIEIKDMTDTDRSASYLDLHLETESEGRFIAKLYDKRDTFNCYLIFLFICSNIPAAPAYGVYISQLNRRSLIAGLLNKEATEPSFLLVKVKSSLRKFYGSHHVLVNRYGISVSQMTTEMFH